MSIASERHFCVLNTREALDRKRADIANELEKCESRLINEVTKQAQLFYNSIKRIKSMDEDIRALSEEGRNFMQKLDQSRGTLEELEETKLSKVNEQKMVFMSSLLLEKVGIFLRQQVRLQFLLDNADFTEAISVIENQKILFSAELNNIAMLRGLIEECNDIVIAIRKMNSQKSQSLQP